MTIPYPQAGAMVTLSVFAVVVLACLGINILGIGLSKGGKFDSLLDTKNWIAPISAIVVISAASTILLCP